MVIHPLLFLLGFAKGLVFNHPQPQPMGPTTGYGDVEAWMVGGINAVEDIVVHYVMTLGIAMIVVSLAGMGLAFLFASFVSRIKSHRP